MRLAGEVGGSGVAVLNVSNINPSADANVGQGAKTIRSRGPSSGVSFWGSWFKSTPRLGIQKGM